MIVSEPILDVKKIAEVYSNKDGVLVKYVCTSALGHEAQAMDIFYRETPHPEFGNRYFGVFHSHIHDHLMITNADKIEEVDFAMIEDSKGDLHYSAHRHDYKVLDSGKMIDGGRSYVKTNGLVKHYVVKNGQFVEPIDADWNWQDSGIENFD